MLINALGQVKMCDFGISGYLVDSVAKTIDAGCKPYMAVSTAPGVALGVQLLNPARKHDPGGQGGSIEICPRHKKYLYLLSSQISPV